jgi:8-hydroxy-5-deazaflavin:NADPH oxidoreductase
MRIGVLGSGVVGRSLAEGLAKLGNEVVLGTRDTQKMMEWAKGKERIFLGSFREAAKVGEVLFLCCNGAVVGDVLALAGVDNFSEKILVDVTNPLVFQKENEPPKMFVGYPDSLGFRVQRYLPETRVVKAFNIVTASYMCHPKLAQGKPDMFIAGNDQEAKNFVSEIAKRWGWDVNDIGDISQSYLLEALAMLWIRYGFIYNNWTHAFALLIR